MCGAENDAATTYQTNRCIYLSASEKSDDRSDKGPNACSNHHQSTGNDPNGFHGMFIDIENHAVKRCSGASSFTTEVDNRTKIVHTEVKSVDMRKIGITDIPP